MQVPPGGLEHAKLVEAPLELYGPDGKKAVVDLTVGYWQEGSDYVTTGDRRFGREGFLRGWPEIYSTNKSLRKLVGKKGLQGTLSRTVDLLTKSELRKELPSLAPRLKPNSSFYNAEMVAEERELKIVKGFAIYELLDTPADDPLFVAHKHWWNELADGSWVDYTPAEQGSNTAAVQVRLLCQSEKGEKAKQTLLPFLASNAKALLKEQREEQKAAQHRDAADRAEEQKKKVAEDAFSSFGGSSAAAALSADSALMFAPEAERLVEDIQTFPVTQVGSKKWMEQHEALQRLNLQAHHNVRAVSDEFVKSYLVSHDKINDLVHELLVVEAWKEKVLPHIVHKLAEGKVGSVNGYLVLYHESVLVNLIEIVLFHKEALEAMSDEVLLELTDYCHRKIVYLQDGGAKQDAEFKNRSAQEMMDMSKGEELLEKGAEIRLGTALSSLTILRYLTDHGEDVNISIVARMLDTHDTIIQLVPLLEERPWVRRRTKGTGKDKKKLTEMYEEGQWRVLPPEDRLKVTKADAQIWLALHNLITDPKCRARYRYDDFRRDTVMRLQRYFNDVLIDQLPVLTELQRVVSEVTMSVVPGSADVTQGRLILEQVPEMRNALMKRDDWQRIGRLAMETYFKDTEEALAAMDSKMQDMVKTFDFMSMLSGNGDEEEVKMTDAEAANMKENLIKAINEHENADADSQLKHHLTEVIKNMSQDEIDALSAPVDRSEELAKAQVQKINAEAKVSAVKPKPAKSKAPTAAKAKAVEAPAPAVVAAPVDDDHDLFAMD